MSRRALFFIVAISPLSAATNITGTITQNTSWDQSGSPYVVSAVTVAVGVTLTVQANVVVKFGSGGSPMLVRGNLVVNGTASQPVVFTSIKDDSVGGDTNGDGNATSPAAGDWSQIYLAGSATFNYALVRYGGAPAPPFPGPSMILVQNSGTTTITNSTFTDSQSAGIYVTVGSQATISGNTFARNASGLTANTATAGTINNNGFNTSSGETAIVMDSGFLGSMVGNTASGSGINAIVVNGGEVSSNVTWTETHMPYYASVASVIPGGSLTIAAGVVVKMGTTAAWAGTPLNIAGNLVVNGTASQPVVFTSIKDDSVGGDTNGDGNATSPAAGDWSQIYLAGNSATFNYALVRYGGAPAPPFPGQSMIYVQNSSTTTITNSTFTDSQYAGIYVTVDSQATISGNTFANNTTGVAASGETATHINNNSFQRNSAYGVFNITCSTSGFCPIPDIDATNNYWGSPSGPWLNPPSGGGDRVSYHVTYIPFLNRPGSATGTAPPQQTRLGLPGSLTNPSGFASEPVNTATGNYYLIRTDLRVPGKGLPFVFACSYNSQDTYTGPLGAGWTHSFNLILAQDVTTGDVAIKEPDGHQDFYSPAGNGSYVPAIAGLFDVLQQNLDNSFALTRKNQTRLTFSSAGRLTSIVDRNGNTQTFDYDSNGNLVMAVDTSGRIYEFAYDADGRITNVSDSIGRSWLYSYDANGNLAAVRDPAGGLTQYSYDANHLMLSATDARGITFLQNTFDNLGRVMTQTNGRGFATAFAYNSPTAGTTTFSDPIGNATQHMYDSSLRLIAVVDAMGGIVSYVYDANNDRTSVTNQKGYTTTFSYDGQGNTTGIVDALGNTQAFTYDTQNDLLTDTNPKNATAIFSYDAKGNLLGTKDALGDTASFTYTSVGQVATSSDARSDTTAYTYDGLGNLIKTIDPLANTTGFTYDGVGRLLTTTDANGHTTSLSYDALSRITKTTDALGNPTQFAYDAIGNLLASTDANGKATTYAYDATNNLASVTDALGGVTTYSYDANNNRNSFKNAKGNATTYTYDALNRLMKVTDPLLFSTSNAYDAVGNTASTTDANGNTNQYTYDALNRLIEGSFADGSSVNYAYDKDGDRTSMRDWRGTTTYAYDALDHVLSVTTPGPSVIQYAYDAAGNRTSLGYPDGRTVKYQYDALNRLLQVTDWASKVTRYSYDPVGNLAGFTYPNGASSSYSYDATNRLAQIIDHSGTQMLSSFAYGLDNVGNRMQVTSAAAGVTKYGYDALYRLTSWTAPSGQATQYTYDLFGNRLSMVSSAGTTTYVYDDDDRMLAAGANSYTYDHNGNQITKTTGPTTVNYTYDALNRLSATAGGINSQYRYDGDGNRVTQTVPTGTYQYLNETATGLPVVLNENGPDGNIDYLYGLSMISETSTAFQYFYQTDGLGSSASLTDATGTLKASYAYDPWGKLTTPIDPLGSKNKYKFTGEAFDSVTGLYYLRARDYDPNIGRFTVRDAFAGIARVPESLQKYQYAFDSPTRFADPTGRSSVDNSAAGQNNNGSTIPIYPLGAATPITISFTQNTVPNVLVPLELPAQRVQDALQAILTSPAPDVGLNSFAGAVAQIPVAGEIAGPIIFVAGNAAKLTLWLGNTSIGQRAIQQLQIFVAGPLGWGPVSF